jgi:hypothetical protein
LRWATGAIGRDFGQVVERYPHLVAAVGPHAAYALVTGGRVLGALFTPMTFHDLATLGFRGAWRVMRERASLTGALTELRAGWSGHGWLSAAEVGAGLLHGTQDTGRHARDAWWHEPPPAPVLPGTGKTGVAQIPVALRNEQLSTLALVMPVLHRDEEREAKDLARVIAEERGGLPLLELAGGAPVLDPRGTGTSGRRLWTPPGSPRPSAMPAFQERGLPAQEGEQHTPLVSAPPDQVPLEQQLAEYNTSVGYMSTDSGLLLSVTSVLRSEAVRRLQNAGLRDIARLLPGDSGALAAPHGISTVQTVADTHPAPEAPRVPTDDVVAGRGTAFAPPAAPPREGTVTDPVTGAVSAETIAVRGQFGKRTGEYWKIDHAAGTAVKVNAAGAVRTERFDTAAVKSSPTGQLMLTVPGGIEGDVVLFAREVLEDGRILHLHTDAAGRVRWTEVDATTGRASRHGTRIWNHDLRTYRDTLTHSWLPFYGYEIRHYTKSLDGGLVRAEKHDDGSWTWQRFDKNGGKVLSGTRTWTGSRIGFTDTYHDPLTHRQSIAQHYGDTWPLTAPHRNRRYLEHALIRDEASGEFRADPVEYLAQGVATAKTEWREHLAGGATLKVVRLSDTRPPAFFWKRRVGGNPFQGFFSNLFAGESLYRLHYWTETQASGGVLCGVRLLASGGSWRDIDEYGRLVRESRKLEDGRTIEAGRSATDPDKWAPAPDFPAPHVHRRSPYPYQLYWRDSKGADPADPASSGIRHVTGPTEWRDVFTDSVGEERIARLAHGKRVREYLAEFPPKDTPAGNRSGIWVEKNPRMQITGRRDRWDDLYIEAYGSPVRATWTWRAYTAGDPARPVGEGIRKQNRGSLFSSTWDDSYTDFLRTPGGVGVPVRMRNATDRGDTWINAMPSADGTHWTWQRITADGTVQSSGIRTYTDTVEGHWSDTINGTEIRYRHGGPVREFHCTPAAPRPTTPPQPGSLAALLATSAHHFHATSAPTPGVTVDRGVWKEFDSGRVLRERKLVDPERRRYREVDHQWYQWREYHNGRLVEQRTIDGRVWRTDAYGPRHTRDVTKLPVYASLPPVRGEVGLDGERSWHLIGREVNYFGLAPELRGIWRTVRDAWAEPWTGVRGGESVPLPMWQRQVRDKLLTFASSYALGFTGTLAAYAAEYHTLNAKAVEKALFNGAVSGILTSAVSLAYDTTRLGTLKLYAGNLDWGLSQNLSRKMLTESWETDLGIRLFPKRWRGATYIYADYLATGALSAFVTGSADAAIFGVNGHRRTGSDALTAGLWTAAATAVTGVSSGLAQNIWHFLAAGRLYSRGGLGDMAVKAVENTLASYLAYWEERGTPLDTTTPLPTPAPPTRPMPSSSPSLSHERVSPAVEQEGPGLRGTAGTP